MFFFAIIFSPVQPEGVFFFLRLTGFETSWLYYLEEVPTLIILTLFTQQVLSWAKAYHVARGEEQRYAGCVLRAALAGNAGVVLVQIMIWVAYFASRGSSVDPDVFSVVAASVHAASFLACAAAMCAYGVANSAFVAGTFVAVDQRRARMRELWGLYGACACAFVLRALALAGASWANLYDFNSVKEDVTPGDAAVTIAVYLFTELLPLWAVLYHHRMKRLQGSSSSSGGGATPMEMASPYAPIGSPGRGGGRGGGRFSFSPTRGGTPSSTGAGKRVSSAGRAGATASTPSSPPMATTTAVWLLGGMVLGAVGLGGGPAAGGGAGERQPLLHAAGPAGAAKRVGLAAAAAGAAPPPPLPPGGDVEAAVGGEQEATAEPEPPGTSEETEK